MNLPEKFLNKMKNLFSEEEYEEFINSYKHDKAVGIRANRLKVNVDEFEKIMPLELNRIPWTKDGFYVDSAKNLGLHPYYHAGLYYIQEPSAMLPAFLLDVKESEWVLDMCAAPGGKTVQIASGMDGKGLLFSNDISKSRIKALVKNIELCGVKNAIILNESPENLAIKYEGLFDKVLVDAPCSGEGMFRKDKDAVKSWQTYKSSDCVVIQTEIMKSADKLLKSGGKLVYSTCTFNPEENEKIISDFLKKNPNYEVENIDLFAGIENGRCEWVDNDVAVKNTLRLWPHKIKGEGHFAAVLTKVSCVGNNKILKSSSKSSMKVCDKNEWDLVNRFVDNNLKLKLEGFFYKIGENIYYMHEQLPDVDNIKIVKFGLYIGKIHNSRFVPAHAFVMSLKKENFNKSCDFEKNSEQINRYLKGETIITECQKGFNAVCVDGYVVGSANCVDGILKNLYPKGWRKQN